MYWYLKRGVLQTISKPAESKQMIFILYLYATRSIMTICALQYRFIVSWWLRKSRKFAHQAKLWMCLSYVLFFFISLKGIIYSEMNLFLKFTEAIQYIDEFVSSSKQIWRNVALHNLVSKWWNATFLQICSDEETNSSIYCKIWGSICEWTVLSNVFFYI